MSDSLSANPDIMEKQSPKIQLLYRFNWITPKFVLGSIFAKQKRKQQQQVLSLTWPLFYNHFQNWDTENHIPLQLLLYTPNWREKRAITSLARSGSTDFYQLNIKNQPRIGWNCLTSTFSPITASYMQTNECHHRETKRYLIKGPIFHSIE